MPSSIQTLLKRGFTPTTSQINHYLVFLSQTKKFKLLFHFIKHLDYNRTTFKLNYRTHSILIQALLSLHKFSEAELFIRTQMIKTRTFPKNRIWDTLIQGFIVHEKDPDKALCILKDCLGKYRIFPSCYTFSSLIHFFSHNGLMDRAVEVLELMMDEEIKYPFSNFVCSSVISGFCRIGKPELALEFFEGAKKSGTLRGPNVVTCTAVVNALCMLGRVDEVCSLVGEMGEKVALDVVFYSCWISGYVKEGALMEALRKYKEMLEKGIGADAVTYTTLMDAFSKRVSEEKVVGFVKKMRRKRVEPNLVSYTVMISGFCRKGNLEAALALFRMVENIGIELDEYLYATLIDGACRKCDFNLVFSLLHEMENKGISPTVVTYNTVVNGLCKAERTSEADEFSKGMLADVVTYSTLMHGYIGEQNVSGVFKTKRRLEEANLIMDVVMCNVLMKASFMVGAFEDAYALYREMPMMNLIPDSFTYCTLIDGYCKAGRIDESLEIFDDFRRTSICSAACYNSIIDGLCKKGMIELAIDVFIELKEKDLPVDVGVYMMLIKAAFNEQGADGVLLFVNRIGELQKDIYHNISIYAIRFLCKRGFFDYACEIYFLLRKKRPTLMCKPYYAIARELLKGKNILALPILASLVKDFGNFDATLVQILVQYLCLKDVNVALQYADSMKKEGFIVKLPASIFRTLLEEGRALDAYTLCINSGEHLPDMNVVDYTVIIDGLCKLGYIDQALDLCVFIKKKGIALTIITYNSVINGLCQQGRLIEAFRLFDSLERVGVLPSDVTYATLIDALCRERQLHDAELLFQKMVLKGYKPNTHTYNSLINAYGSIGKMEKAFKLFHDFERKGLKADEFTVSALINGYCQKGDMEGALEFFSVVKIKNLSPDLLGFLYLVRGLNSKGRLEEARNVLREMLQSQSVAELIKKVDCEVETESVHMFLVSLCEQGSVKEAIAVLDEIAFMHFPVRRFSNEYAGSQIESKSSKGEVCDTDNSNLVVPQEERDLKIGLWERKKEANVLDSMKRHTLVDFDSFHSLVASLCMRGELHKAKLLLKNFLC